MENVQDAEEQTPTESPEELKDNSNDKHKNWFSQMCSNTPFAYIFTWC